MFCEPTNSTRADLARAALDAGTDCNDPYTDVVDLLCNLRHYCDRNQVDFGAADHSAYNTHYLVELDEERERQVFDNETIQDGARAALDGFWEAVGQRFPDVPGDYHDGAEDDTLRAAAEAVLTKWLDGKARRNTWEDRIERYGVIAEYHDVRDTYMHPADPAHLPESRDFALVLEGNDSGQNVLYAFDTFGELCDQAAECVLGSDVLLAAYDLRTRRAIPLHVTTPVVSESDDAGSAPLGAFDQVGGRSRA